MVENALSWVIPLIEPEQKQQMANALTLLDSASMLHVGPWKKLKVGMVRGMSKSMASRSFRCLKKRFHVLSVSKERG